MERRYLYELLRMAKSYRYEVLLLGSFMSRPDIGSELSKRGADGWRVVSGSRGDDGSWSFVLEIESERS